MLQLNKYIFTSLLCISICIQHAAAQDPHFSQYFSSPLTFNPAFTGYFDGTQRVSVNLRSQWTGLSDPYNTGTASFDTKIMKDKIGTNDRWGFGVHALYDQSSGGIFKNSYVALSTAFNKGLDAEGDQSIGIGVQVVYAYNNVDFNKVSYSSQFTGSGFDLGVPSGETVNNKSVSYFDLNAGILYNYKDETGNQFSFGASMFHVLRPELSFFSGKNNSVDQRYTLHAGAGFVVGEKDNFFISSHIMQQAGATEFVIGGAYGIGLGASEATLYLGTWLRAKDALYPYLGIQTNSYQLGLSYDITSSDSNRAKNFNGSSELSFSYFFNNDRKKKGIPCFF
jgi:type IX secretion system PorP/SprF family membrane protein